MKSAAIIFGFLMSLLAAYPAIRNAIDVNIALQTCCSSKSACDPDKHSGNKERGCEDSDCNPFIGCASGSFFTTAQIYVLTIYEITETQKAGFNKADLAHVDLPTLWHPPDSEKILRFTNTI